MLERVSTTGESNKPVDAHGTVFKHRRKLLVGAALVLALITAVEPAAAADLIVKA